VSLYFVMHFSFAADNTLSGTIQWTTEGGKDYGTTSLQGKWNDDWSFDFKNVIEHPDFNGGEGLEYYYNGKLDGATGHFTGTFLDKAGGESEIEFDLVSE
jgi:hypothetical protein